MGSTVPFSAKGATWVIKSLELTTCPGNGPGNIITTAASPAARVTDRPGCAWIRARTLRDLRVSRALVVR
jgi:hypothetical protein